LPSHSSLAPRLRPLQRFELAHAEPVPLTAEIGSRLEAFVGMAKLKKHALQVTRIRDAAGARLKRSAYFSTVACPRPQATLSLPLSLARAPLFAVPTERLVSRVAWRARGDVVDIFACGYLSRGS